MGRLVFAVVVSVVFCTSAAWAADIVVDQAASGAADGNPGTAEKPMRTIAAAVAKVQAGDTVTVKSGTYPETVKIAASGTAEKPITLRAAPGEKVVIGGPSSDRHGLTWAAGVGYLSISGFTVNGGSGIGSMEKGGHHVRVTDCVIIGGVIRLGDQSDCLVRHCVQTGAKGNGVSLSGCKNCIIEECEVFGNGADGIVVTFSSDGCKVLRNYVHNHWNDDHPDGIQVYRTVTNFTVEGNLFFNSGQGFMLEETDGGVFRNNMVVGTHHSGMILGHNNSHNWTVEQNTFAYTGFKAFTYSGKGTVLRNNVILAGGDNMIVVQAGKDPLVSDYNLYWKANERSKLQTGEGQDAHSKFGDPKFRSAPALGRLAAYFIDTWSDKEAAAKSSTGKLSLGGRPLTESFKVGDMIEVNFDGRLRKVTEVIAETVAFEPPLDKMHQYPWETVVNWKDRTAIAWDCRLADDSPGKKMGDRGQDVGSSVDMPAYMKGDFNGDGKRDLPAASAARTSATAPAP